MTPAADRESIGSLEIRYPPFAQRDYYPPERLFVAELRRCIGQILSDQVSISTPQRIETSAEI